jgi:hypothetical protein
MLKRFWKELEEGEIHFRDQWQFELKSEFSSELDASKTAHSQEIFLFIPNSLHVNPSTYSKDQFYRDQTTLVRLKTPELSMAALCDPTNSKSPLSRVEALLPTETTESVDEVQKQLKLLGNIMRSEMRRRVAELLRQGEKGLDEEAVAVCDDTKRVLLTFRTLQQRLMRNWTSPEVGKTCMYVDEFLSRTADYYFSCVLQKVRETAPEQARPGDQAISDLLIEEQKHRAEVESRYREEEGDGREPEYLLYRKGLLNKFVMDALLLNTNRTAVEKRFADVIGATAAALAMLIYIVFFIWQGEYFVLNSIPFVFGTVFLYVIKDRLKEWARAYGSSQLVRWFPDYQTRILTPGDDKKVGSLREFFSWIRTDRVPEEVHRIRNQEFHADLETFKRPESVIHYKREVNLSSELSHCTQINTTFRFNLVPFLQKLANPYDTILQIDAVTRKLRKLRVPKVYHLNVVMKNHVGSRTEYKKFRIILDKTGIKRVEHLGASV